MSDVSVLFVCMGNICRSPTAEGVMRARVEAAGLENRLSIDSAGTISYHAGEAPDRRSQAAALRRGYDLSEQRARQVRAGDLMDFDYVLAMDADNLAHLERLAAEHDAPRATVKLFLEYASAHPEREVPDPYYGGERGFDHVLDLCEAAADGLLREIKAKL